MPRFTLILTVGLVAGCSEQTEPVAPKAPPVVSETAPSKAVSNAPKDVKQFLLDVFANQFGVDRSVIDMKRPIGIPPLNADELDLVELIMELEEGFDVTIPDEDLESITGMKSDEVLTRITPEQLVTLTKRAQEKEAKKGK